MLKKQIRTYRVRLFRLPAVFGLCLTVVISQLPQSAFAENDWGCISQDAFWTRVQETTTRAAKSHEITLSGRQHDSGYSHSNEFFQSLHIFEDGAWVILNMTIREAEPYDEVLYCLISRGTSSAFHQF